MPRNSMDTHTHDYTDNRLAAGTAAQCALHLILGADSLSMLVADPAGAVVALQSYSFSADDTATAQTEWQIRGLLQGPVFTLPFGQAHCALFHRNATLVPRRLFQHGDLSGYFKLLLEPADYVYAYDELPEFDAYLVYATEQGLARLCPDFFPRARVRHLAVPLLRQALNLHAEEEHRIFLNIRNQVAQIAVFERRNLLFYNAFSFSASPDLLYYLLLVYDQFRLDPREIPLTVAGNLLEDSELYRLFHRFIREIRFAPLPAHFHLPAGVNTLPGHCYFDLFCLKNL